MLQFRAISTRTMEQPGVRHTLPRQRRHRLTKLLLLTLAGAIFAGLPRQVLAAETNQRPNVILIMADDI